MHIPKYSIVIPTYNHLDDCLKPCIESIIKNTDLSDAEVIVVANGCIDGTKEYVESLGNQFRLIWIDEAAGYTKATNEGIKASVGEFIVLLNNDNIILNSNKNEWLNILNKPFLEQEMVGITGAAKDIHPLTGCEFLLFFCVMISRKVINKIGLLDEAFNPGYGEDIDYCNKSKEIGYKIIQVPDDIYLEKPRELDEHVINFPIYHKGGATVHSFPQWNETVSRNELLLINRYSPDLSIKNIKNLQEKDERTFNTVFLENEYSVLGKEILNRTVIDIGANIGCFTALCLKHHAKKIIAIEPVAENFDYLQKIFIENHKVVLLNNAVLGQSGSVVSFKESQSMTHVVKDSDTKSISINLEKIIENIVGDDLVLKIDCEGSEFDILFNTKKEIIRRFETIYIEIHGFGTCGDNPFLNEKCTLDSMKNYIESLGYEIVFNKQYYSWKKDNNGNRYDEKPIPIEICKFYRKQIQSIKYSIVIPTYNHLDDCLKPCIESIIKYTDLSDKEIIIVANGCTDGTKEYVKSLGEKFKLLWFDDPLGYSKPLNEGIKFSQGTHVIIMNNDTQALYQFKDTWISMLKEPFLKDDKTGATGPLSILDRYSNYKVLLSFCMMIRKDAFYEAGMFDESYGMGAGEDVDFCVRLINKGYKLVQVPELEKLPREGMVNIGNFPMYHKGGACVDDLLKNPQSHGQSQRNCLKNMIKYNKDIRITFDCNSDMSDIDKICPLTVSDIPLKGVILMNPFNLEFQENTVKEIHAGDMLDNPCDINKVVENWSKVLNKDGKVFINSKLIGKKVVDKKDLSKIAESIQIIKNMNIKPPKYSIVIPTYNHLDDCLRPCLESIKTYTDLSLNGKDDVEVIVVANGCIDGTREYVESLGKPFRLIFEEKQLGYTRAMNIGLKAALGEYVVFLNNDIVLVPQDKNAWLNYLRIPFERVEKVGMTGPLVFKGVEGSSNDFVMFFCAMTTRKIIDEIGYLDEIYSPGGVEDVDYGLRLLLAGYKLVSVPMNENVNRSPGLSSGAFPIFHAGGATCSKEKGWNDVLIRNNNILKQKFPKYFHGLDWIEEMAKNKKPQDNIKKKACIIVQATGNYCNFVKDLVESINAYFMTDCYKDVVILSDIMPPGTQVLGENCVIHNRKCKSVYKASYFFELMLENLDLISKADYCYKMDADMIVYKPIPMDDILPTEGQNYSIVKHFSFDQKWMANIRPKNFSANIPEEYQNCPYWQSCIFGGRTEQMIQMAKELNHMIEKDRNNKSMWGAWEEPYVNWYLSRRQSEVRTLSPAYASPLYWHRFPMEYKQIYLKSVDMTEQIFHLNHTVQFGGHELG